MANEECPYAGWHLYFADEQYTKTSPIVAKVKAAEKFFAEMPEVIVESLREDICSIDVNVLYSNQQFNGHWPDFKGELKNAPERAIGCLGMAAHKVRLDRLTSGGTEIDEETANERVKIKILNYEPIVPLKDIKVSYHGRFVTVSGPIVRVGRSCQMASSLVFLCQKCKASYQQEQKNGIYTPKKTCDNCGSTKLKDELSSPHVKTTSLQLLRIQEYFGEERGSGGRTPRMIDVECIGDSADNCIPGADITVTGIVELHGTDNGKQMVPNATSPLYIEANCLVHNNGRATNTEGSRIEFSASDYRAIRAIHENPNKLDLLVNSLCPGIHGHDMIKTALLLTLFGGSWKHTNSRFNIHMLIVGDPGMGKSQMLQACSRVAPKGVYISGNSSSSSGLTVSLVREKGDVDFSLEPGALVLADGGCCCIDEFDRMPTQHQALLEAMEQQTVSVAKSGVISSLPARTSIVAAANPIGGRYDKSKVWTKNLNMSPALLSRFDLIFLLIDEPDENNDEIVAGHVMRMHTGNRHTNHQAPVAGDAQNSSTSSPAKEVITSALLRKYISYARQHVHPILSPAAAAVLQKHYLLSRETADTTSTSIVCARQLESLIRLTEARAKLDLREETTEQDALEIIMMMGYTIMEVNAVEINFTLVNNNKTVRGAMKNFLKILSKDAEEKRSNLFSDKDLKTIAQKAGYSSEDRLAAIDKINQQGIIIKINNGMYKYIPQ